MAILREPRTRRGRLGEAADPSDAAVFDRFVQNHAAHFTRGGCGTIAAMLRVRNKWIFRRAMMRWLLTRVSDTYIV